MSEKAIENTVRTKLFSMLFGQMDQKVIDLPSKNKGFWRGDFAFGRNALP